MMDSLESSEYVQLLRKMGHDMRVPLNTLISTSDMLLDGAYDPLTPKQEKAALRLQRNNHRLLAILDDFLTYIKAETGDLVLTSTSFDPRAQLDAWCAPIRKVTGEKGLAFSLSASDRLPDMMRGDETAIKRILQALLWNSVAYTSQGEIQVSSDWTAKQAWRISVNDSGSGISESDLPHIFEPFWRGEERPQLPTAGAGLGLPMALALVKLIGGSLSLQETTAQGSVFCVELPMEKPE